MMFYRCRPDHPVYLTLTAFSLHIWTAARAPDHAVPLPMPSRCAVPLHTVLRQLDQAAQWGAARCTSYGCGDALAVACWRAAGTLHLAVIDRKAGRAWTAKASDAVLVSRLARHAAAIVRRPVERRPHRAKRPTTPVFTITAA